MNVVDELRRAIIESNLPYAVLAKTAGVSPSVIAHFLNDDRVVRLDTAVVIAGALGLEIQLRRVRDADVRVGTAPTTKPGTVNTKSQKVIGETGESGNTAGQRAYEMQCMLCKFKYRANGADVWQRKCPRCQGGRPGL